MGVGSESAVQNLSSTERATSQKPLTRSNKPNEQQMIHTPATSGHFSAIIKAQTTTDWIDSSYGNDDCDSIESEMYQLRVHFPNFSEHQQFQLSIFDYRSGDGKVAWEHYESICELIIRINSIIKDREDAINPLNQ